MRIINNSSLSMEEIQQILSARGRTVYAPPPGLDWNLYEHFIIDWGNDGSSDSEPREATNEPA